MREMLYAPEKLQELIDSDTLGYVSHKSRRENPFPDLRTTDGQRHKVAVTHAAGKAAARQKGNRNVHPDWMYLIHCKTNTEKRNSQRIDESNLDLVLFMPRDKKNKLLYPGNIFIGFDHPMTGDEFHKLMMLHAGIIEQMPMPRSAGRHIRSLCEPGKEAS